MDASVSNGGYQSSRVFLLPGGNHWKNLFPEDSGMTATAQIQLDFTPTLTDQFRTLKECLSAVVYSSRVGLSGVAAACDLAPSELCKVLSESEGRRCDVNLIEPIVRETGDHRPILWLAAKFCVDEQTKQQQAVAQLETMLPAIQAALKTLGAK